MTTTVDERQILDEQEVLSLCIRDSTRAICDQLGVRAPVQAIVWAARRGLL